MSKSVFGIATTLGQAERIVQQLQAEGFAASEISVLMPDTGGTRDVGHVKAKTLIGRSTFSKLPALRISAPLAKHRHQRFKQMMRRGNSMADENQMDQGSAVPPQAKEKAERGVTHAHKAAEDLRSAAGKMAD